MNDTREDRLKAVYGAQGPDELERGYDAWAEAYDSDLQAFGYTSPAVTIGLAARHIVPGQGPLLDAGAGTGIMGRLLALIGYHDLVALDLSEGMLAVARGKGVYRELHQAALGDPLALPDDAYAGVVCVGTFTAGHVGPEGLDELVRVTRPGGAVVYTITRPVYDAFQAKQDALEREGKWRLLEVSGEFDPLPAEADAPMSKVMAYQVR